MNQFKFQKDANKFKDSPTYLSNCLRAFAAGGSICLIGHFIKTGFLAAGMDKETAGIWSTIALIMIAQLLTGIGIYDVIGKYGGAGSAVPITGFANSVVAPAMEYKREGPVLGVGAKIFSLAGPVILLGLATSWACGLVRWMIQLIF